MCESHTHDNGLLIAQLLRDGVVRSPEAEMLALAGGVSSDIFLVRDGDRAFVVKRALPKLRVRADWQADVSRNLTEQHYIRYVSGIVPGAVPTILRSGDGYFTMEFLGGSYTTWKSRMLGGRFELASAVAAGGLLGTIHAHASRQSLLSAKFDTDRGFYQLRVDPFLLTCAERHPRHAAALRQEAERLLSHHESLVHGDYSPKNLMIDDDSRLVVLDCEVAWFGDPAFDAAFCLTHLLLKALHRHPLATPVRALAAAFQREYLRQRRLKPGDSDNFDARTARLLRMLLLARVDGKSPVEYLDEHQRSQVRGWVGRVGLAGDMATGEVVDDWFKGLGLPETEPR